MLAGAAAATASSACAQPGVAGSCLEPLAGDTPLQAAASARETALGMRAIAPPQAALPQTAAAAAGREPRDWRAGARYAKRAANGTTTRATY